MTQRRQNRDQRPLNIYMNTPESIQSQKQSGGEMARQIPPKHPESKKTYPLQNQLFKGNHDPWASES